MRRCGTARGAVVGLAAALLAGCGGGGPGGGSRPDGGGPDDGDGARGDAFRAWDGGGPGDTDAGVHPGADSGRPADAGGGSGGAGGGAGGGAAGGDPGGGGGGGAGGGGAGGGAGGGVGPLPPGDDAEWPDPSWSEGGGGAAQEPPPAPYGTFSPEWFAANRGRYGRDNLPRSIMQIGDSLSESMAFLWIFRWPPYAPSGISDAEGYVHVDKELGTLSGQTSDWGRDRAERACREGRAELTTVLFGTNDVVQGVYEPGRFRRNIESIVDRCIARGTLPMLMTLPPLEGSTRAVESPNQVMRAIATERQLPLFDFSRVITDRNDLRRDMPDGVHPNLAMYEVINREWVRFYKYVEWHVLAPQRPQAEDPVAEDRAKRWSRVFEQDFAEDASLDGWQVQAGDWRVSGGALVGVASPEGSAVILLPRRVAGPTRVEIVAESDGAEISLLTNNAGDPQGIEGWYFGFGTNGGRRTAINFDDETVGEAGGLRPRAGQQYAIRAYRSDNFARMGLDGRYVLTTRVVERPAGPGRDRVGLYTYGGTLRVRRIVVWE